MTGWQPIETFPKDRLTSFLFWDGLTVGQGQWDGGRWFWIWGAEMDVAPTHWRELPEPPK